MSQRERICGDCGETISEHQHKAVGVCKACERALLRCWQKVDRVIDRLEGR